MVSILMPAFNAAHFIGKAIECVLSQSYQDFELLIADDNSTDNTLAVIGHYAKQDKRIKLFTNTQNLGYLQTWNRLIKEAKGEFITFLDADDLCATNRIELLLDALNAHPEIAVVGSNYKRITTDNKVVESSNFPLNHDEIVAAMPNNFYFIGSALMIRRTVYEKIGGYHTFFDRMGAEDHYWVYLILEQFKIMNVPDALYFYRFNQNSVSGNIANNPSKINVPLILEHLINQRRTTGTDDLQQGNIDKLRNMLFQMNKPFLDNPSYYFYYVAKRRFYEGHKRLAIKHICQAILKDPLNFNYYKDLFYFLRT